jgi:predicted nucleotidyltransferase
MLKLKGRNRIERFRYVAEGLVSRIASCEGIAGIFFIGGLVRRFADKFSDLDITIFLSKRDESLRRQIHRMGLDEKRRSGIDIDLEVYFLEDFKRWKLGEAYTWELSRAEIVFDSEGETRKVLDDKLKVPKDFWKKRIVICGEYLKWYCCPAREEAGTIAEAWIERGDLLAAHYCLNYSVDLLIRLIFALNKEFLPAPKWRIFYSYSLKWLPLDYKELIKQATIINDSSVKDLNRRLRAIRKMCGEIFPKIEDETGLTTEQISKHYVEKILRQTWIPSRH